MSSWTPPFAYGEKSPAQSPSSSFNSLTVPPGMGEDLGKKWMVNGNTYKLVQATAALTKAQVQGLMMADSGTTYKTHLVAAASASATTRNRFAGVGALVSPGAAYPLISQVALNANDYFLVQTNGRAYMVTGTNGATTNLPVIIDSTAGGGTVTVDVTAVTIASLVKQVGIAQATTTSTNGVEVELFEIT